MPFEDDERSCLDERHLDMLSFRDLLSHGDIAGTEAREALLGLNSRGLEEERPRVTFMLMWRREWGSPSSPNEAAPEGVRAAGSRWPQRRQRRREASLQKSWEPFLEICLSGWLAFRRCRSAGRQHTPPDVASGTYAGAKRNNRTDYDVPSKWHPEPKRRSKVGCPRAAAVDGALDAGENAAHVGTANQQPA